MIERINNLYNKDDKSAYNTLLGLESITEKSNELYGCFEELLNMLSHENSFVRVRGFRLICALAKWDIDNKINDNIDIILNGLEDEKGTAIRQCLSKINLILIHKTELKDKIKNKLRNINISKYKENMQMLIKKDIDNLLKI